MHQAVVLAAFGFETAGHLGADSFNGPAMEILVEVAGRSFQLRGVEVVVELEHPIEHAAGFGDNDAEHASSRKAREVDVLQGVEFLGRSQGHAQTAGDERQHM